jgi:hypothetical protein
MPVGLLPCRSPSATRRKSAPEPTTPCAPRRAHRRRSDELCATKPPEAAGHPLLASSGNARIRSPTKTAPTVPGWSFGSPYPTTASASRIPGAYASPGRSPPAASHHEPTEDLLRIGVEVDTQEGLGFEPPLRDHGSGPSARARRATPWSTTRPSRRRSPLCAPRSRTSWRSWSARAMSSAALMVYLLTPSRLSCLFHR